MLRCQPEDRPCLPVSIWAAPLTLSSRPRVKVLWPPICRCVRQSNVIQPLTNPSSLRSLCQMDATDELPREAVSPGNISSMSALESSIRTTGATSVSCCSISRAMISRWRRATELHSWSASVYTFLRWSSASRWMRHRAVPMDTDQPVSKKIIPSSLLCVIDVYLCVFVFSLFYSFMGFSLSVVRIVAILFNLFYWFTDTSLSSFCLLFVWLFLFTLWGFRYRRFSLVCKCIVAILNFSFCIGQ